MRAVEQLANALRGAWCAETSFWPETWSPENPAHGQCAVTALAVHDALGGKIIEGWAKGERHYWNEVEGKVIDLTWEQFPAKTRRVIAGPIWRVPLETNDSTRLRYELLKTRLTRSLIGASPAGSPSHRLEAFQNPPLHKEGES